MKIVILQFKSSQDYLYSCYNASFLVRKNFQHKVIRFFASSLLLNLKNDHIKIYSIGEHRGESMFTCVFFILSKTEFGNGFMSVKELLPGLMSSNSCCVQSVRRRGANTV